MCSVKKGTIPMDVQQSVRRLDSMILDYTVSSVEKMDTLPVGVKKMIITSMTEVQDPKPERHNQALFKSLTQGTMEVHRWMGQRS